MRIRWLLILIFMIGSAIHPVLAQEEDEEEQVLPLIFGRITFSMDITLDTNQPIFPMEVFPFNTPVIIGQVDIRNIPEDTRITTQWVLNGEEKATSDYIHDRNSERFQLWTPLSGTTGIEPGIWTLRYLIDGSVKAESSVEVTTSPFIFPVRFGTACGRFTGEMVDYVEEYERGTRFIVAQVRYANYPERVPIEGYWFLDGEELVGEGLPIEVTLTASGQRCLRLGGNQDLAPGTYELQIREGGLVVQSASIEVQE